jgi:hypothetical protein
MNGTSGNRKNTRDPGRGSVRIVRSYARIRVIAAIVAMLIAIGVMIWRVVAGGA